MWKANGWTAGRTDRRRTLTHDKSSHGLWPGELKRCTRLASASDKVYQLLAHGRWFSLGTPASTSTKTGRHDIAEILLKLALNTINQIKLNQILNNANILFRLYSFIYFFVIDNLHTRKRITFHAKFNENIIIFPHTLFKMLITCEFSICNEIILWIFCNVQNSTSYRNIILKFVVLSIARPGITLPIIREITRIQNV